SAVGPMAGVISPSMPVWVVEDRARGNRAYCNLNEGLGKVLRFGAHAPEVLNRNAAATSLLFKRLAPAMSETDVPRDVAAQTLAFIAGNDHFFLNLSM